MINSTDSVPNSSSIKRLNILILSDSLALPRVKPEFCHQRDTWPALLQEHGHRITQLSLGGGTSHDLVSQCNYYKKETLDIDVVLIQSGIVDCAPRFAWRLEVKSYQVIPVVGKWIIKLLNRNFIRQIRNITYINPKKYAKNIHVLKQNFSPYPVFFLSILPAQDAYEKVLKGIQKNTSKYNEILQETQNCLDLSAIPLDGIMSDFHHLNAKGHRFIFEEIQKILQSKI